jgi:hypothetical protein
MDVGQGPNWGCSANEKKIVAHRESLQADSQLTFAVVRSEKLVAEIGNSSGTQRKENVRRWKPLLNSTVKTLI